MLALAASRIQRAWRAKCSRRLSSLATRLRELSTCVVCGDECTLVRRCPHAHACCLGCSASMDDVRCPMCREACHPVVDGAFDLVLRAARARMKCGTCGVHVDADACETHRAWCPGHSFACPSGSDACPRAILRSDVATHAVAHHGARVLADQDGRGTHTVAVAFSRADDGPLLAVVGGDTLVVLAVTSVLPGVLRDPRDLGALRLHARAYYPSPHSPPVRATVRHVRLASRDDASDSEGEDGSAWWWDEFRFVVRPVLASSELVDQGASTAPLLSPRSFLPRGALLSSPLRVPGPLFVVPDVRDEEGRRRVLQTARLRGVRSLFETAASDTSVAVVLAHITLKVDAGEKGRRRRRSVGERFA